MAIHSAVYGISSILSCKSRIHRIHWMTIGVIMRNN